jgi:hypothetical protein
MKHFQAPYSRADAAKQDADTRADTANISFVPIDAADTKTDTPDTAGLSFWPLVVSTCVSAVVHYR